MLQPHINILVETTSFSALKEDQIMIKSILQKLKEMTASETTNLEAYIISNKPQNADDIDRLEREFFRKQTSNGLFTHFHE